MRARPEGAAPRGATPPRDERLAMIAKVHIAKVRLGMGEDDYRDMLKRVTGLTSAGLMAVPELDAVLKELRRLGFKDRPARGAAPSHKAQIRMVHALWKDLAPHLTDGSVTALRSFVQRQTKSPARPEGIAAPEFLGPEDANKVVEGLKAWLARVRQRARLRAEAEAEGVNHGG